MKVSQVPFKFSLVIPVYNEEDHITACLEAVAAQTEMPLEVIVVDNGCTDATIVLARQFSFVSIVHEPRKGIAHARNAGFDAARGDLIGRIDADTIIPEDWVHRMRTYLQAHPGELLTGGCYFYDLSFPRLFGWMQGQIAFRMNKLILGQYIAWGSNMAFSANWWRKVRNEVHNDVAIHEDIDLGMHVHARGCKITYDPNFKVGIDSRMLSDKRQTREQHMQYLVMWPRTLEKHHLKRAWIGWAGVYIVYCSYLPVLTAHRIGLLYRFLRPADQKS